MKTVTVGIPAYNEAENLPYLIKSILQQKQQNFILEKIIIVSDGSTDGTVDIVKNSANKDSRIEIHDQIKRQGKAAALNKIYDLNKSDYLFVPDADIVMENHETIEELIKCFLLYPLANLISARHIPEKASSLMGKFAVYSYLSLEDAFMKYKNGDNFYSVMSASMITREFARTFRYPGGTLSDQCYLYAKATRGTNQGYKFAKNARVIFRTITTFHDWRLLGQRSVIGDKADVAKYFGPEILREYTLPKKIIIKSLLVWLFKHPIYIGGSILMNIFIRLFPYQKNKPKEGKWEPSKSSKIGIIL